MSSKFSLPYARLNDIMAKKNLHFRLGTEDI